MPPSKDGKGRTLWEILSGRNKRDMTPLELQYHNPLGAKVGCSVSVDHDPEFRGINFVIERISVYETKIKARKFYHTDYHLKAVLLEREKPLRIRLRLIPDENEANRTGCKVQVLTIYDEMEYNEDFHAGVLCHESGEFHVTQDDLGEPLAESRKYWRVEDVLDPYRARVTILSDKDGDGKVEDDELERIDVTYWDYHRDTKDEYNVPFREFLTVEMNDKSRYFTFLRGREVGAFQIMVI
jgi:hypothetical protein